MKKLVDIAAPVPKFKVVLVNVDLVARFITADVAPGLWNDTTSLPLVENATSPVSSHIPVSRLPTNVYDGNASAPGKFTIVAVSPALPIVKTLVDTAPPVPMLRAVVVDTASPIVISEFSTPSLL